MENPAPFDLNHAIQQWRQQLAASPAIGREDFDELESHLRDAVGSLEAKGLTSAEAFWIARHRLGSEESLRTEFGKVNMSQVWLDRALWMVLGFIGIGAVSNVIRQLSQLVSFGLHQWTSIGLSIGSMSALVFPIALSLAVLAFLRSDKRNHATLSRFGCWAQEHPGLAALMVIALQVLQIAVTTGFNRLVISTLPLEKYAEVMGSVWLTSILQMLFWPVLLGWLLAKAYRHSQSLSKA